MAYEFKLPDIGEGVVEGEIVRWLVKEGDVLRADQPMVEVMTDKATVEIPSPKAGKVTKRMFAEGQICPVGRVLVVLEEDGVAATPSAARAEPASPAASARPMESATAGRSAAVPTSFPGSLSPAHRPNGAPAAPLLQVGGDVLATPATRKLARELGVELGAVRGTGPAGRITSDDVRAASGGPRPGAAPIAAAAGDVRIPFRGLRKKIAENLTRSKREAAHFTYVEEVDCTQLVALRIKANERLAGQGVKLSFLPFIIKATVGALKRFPQLNATLDAAASEIVQRRQYHIGLASATADGLVVPVVRDADRRSLVDLAREIDRLAAATKAGRATRDELTGSTFTITSLGQLGGVLATPIINHPEVAILGVHKISKRPAVAEDKIVIRDLMNLSISVDHRLVDGYEAAQFVAEIKEALEQPGLLFLESV
jgi:pyruvate dehydrogenase E2 component (dihydrolipoamide acetyltransferase)